MERYEEETRTGTATSLSRGMVAREESTQPAIAAEFAGMRNDLADLDKIVEALSAKLSPVMHTRPNDMAAKRGMIVDEASSPILSNVMEYRVRIQSARDDLVTLLDRLEV